MLFKGYKFHKNYHEGLEILSDKEKMILQQNISMFFSNTETFVPLAQEKNQVNNNVFS